MTSHAGPHKCQRHDYQDCQQPKQPPRVSVQRKNQVLRKIPAFSKINGRHNDRQHESQRQDQALGLEVRHPCKAFRKFLELFWIGPREVQFRQPLIDQAGSCTSEKHIAFEDPERRRQYFQSRQRLQDKKDQVTDEKGL